MKNNVRAHHYIFQNTRGKENNAIPNSALTSEPHKRERKKGNILSRNKEKNISLIFTQAFLQINTSKKVFGLIKVYNKLFARLKLN